MVRPSSSIYAKSFLSIVAAGLVILSACGEKESAGMQQRSDVSMALAMDRGHVVDITNDNIMLNINGNSTDANTAGNGNSTDGNTCTEIMASIHAGRKAVAATPQWVAFAATPEWQAVKQDGEVLQRLHCKHNDPAPSYACTQVIETLKQNFALAQATAEYEAVSTLSIWKTLQTSYDEARANQCLPSQQHGSGGAHDPNHPHDPNQSHDPNRSYDPNQSADPNHARDPNQI